MRAKRLEARPGGCGSGRRDPLERVGAPSGSRAQRGSEPRAPRALGRGALQSSGQGVAARQSRSPPKLSDPDQRSPPRPRASLQPAGPQGGRGSHHVPPGPYLSGVHFGVLRRCIAAQTVQKHQQQQREQPSSAAEAAAGAARPSERAPVAAHALWPPAGSRALQAGLARWMAPGPRTRLGNLRLFLAPGPLGGGPRAPGACRSRSSPLCDFPNPRRSGVRGDSPAGLGGRPSCTPQTRAASARCALAPTPESQHNSGAFVWLSAPAARSRGAPCAPCSLCPCPGPPALPRARASRRRLHLSPRPTGPGSPGSPGRSAGNGPGERRARPPASQPAS